MKKTNPLIARLGVILAALLWSGLLYAETSSLTGEIVQVGDDHINLNFKVYPIKSPLKGVDMSKALMGNKTKTSKSDVKVWYQNKLLSYQTIRSIGYVNKAKVNFNDGFVSEIFVLELDQ